MIVLTDSSTLKELNQSRTSEGQKHHMAKKLCNPNPNPRLRWGGVLH